MKLAMFFARLEPCLNIATGLILDGIDSCLRYSHIGVVLQICFQANII